MRRCPIVINILAVFLVSFSLTTLAQSPSSVSFQAARTYDTGLSPFSVVIADFNGDGKPDMAVPGNNGVGGITVFLGDGSGNFPTSKTSVAGENNPGMVAVGDFNGDGLPDIAMSGWVGSDTVCVLLGHGDGTFQSPLCYGTVARSFGVAVGDFNGDGKADLVLSSPDNGSLSVLLGNGDGTFQQALNYASGVRAYFVAAADVNGDGRIDLLTTDNDSAGRLNVLLGNGDGTFGAPMHNTVGNNPLGFVVADFNGDGRLDVAVGNYFDNNVSILLGNGDGTFQTAVNYPAGAGLYWVAAGDVDGDGKLDLLVADYAGETVSVLRNNGDGTFRAPEQYGVGTNPSSVAIADFDGDGHADLVVTNTADSTVSVLRNNGDGTFLAAPTYKAASQPTSVATDDFNGDGRIDVVAANRYSNSVSVLMGNGNGRLQAPVNYGTGTSPYFVVTGDFNHDGRPDLAVANNGSNDLSVLLGNGDGTFNPAANYSVGSGPTSVATGDFNGDGTLDLVVTNSVDSSVSVLLGIGNGNFEPAVTYSAGLLTFTVTVADVNHDGKLDLAVGSYGDNTIGILLGNGDGTFGLPLSFATGTGPYSVVAQDFDGDGNLDLAAASYSDGSVSVLFGNGDGTFRTPVNYHVDSYPDSIATRDFNGDGNPDLAVANSHSGNVSLLLGNGDGTFQAPVNFGSGSTPSSLAVGDFDGDGKPDLAVANQSSLDYWSASTSNVAILLNRTATFTKAVITSPPPGSTLSGDTATFIWSPTNPSIGYQLDIGSVPGGTQYFQSGNLGNVVTVTASGLPVDGSTLYVTLRFSVNGGWVQNRYVYSAYNVGATRGILTTPPPGSTFSDSTVTFDWNPGTQATAYRLDAGSTSGGTDYYQSGNLGNTLTVTVSGFPLDGSTVYVTLWSLVSGTWVNNQYTYSAFNVSTSQAVLTTPAPGSRFQGSTVSFAWSAGHSATAYELDAGSTPGGNDYYHSGDLGNVFSTNAAGLPTDGSTVYVTLYSKIFGQWYSGAYIYKAYNPDAAPITFLPEVNYDAQASPASVVMADINGDHKLDLVVGNFYGDPNCQCTGSVSVMLGKGDGSFQAAANYPTGPGTWGVAVGDFNGDGKPDVVAANYGESSVSVLLGSGDGTLRPAISYTTGSNPNSVAVGDLNGDGQLDLVTANAGDNTITVLIGRGDGTFKPPSTYNMGQLPYSVAIGDVNGDGKLDVVVANQIDASISVLLGNGNGTLGAAKNYHGLQAPYAVALGDLNGDGKLDIVASDNANGSVDVMLGKGDGTFNSPIPYAAGISPTGVTIGDFNDDGSPDLAVADGSGSSEISVSGGKGDGSFASPLMFNGGQCTFGIAAGDLDGDGKADLAVADFCGNTVNILLTSSGPAQITSPPPGSTLTDSSATFQWSNSPAATAFSLSAGSTPGGNQYYSSGNLPSTTHSATVNTLPVDGSTVYVTLSSLINGQWVQKAYTYTAFNLAAAKGVLTTPAPGSTLSGSTVSFVWNPGIGATAYMLDAGSTPGGHEYFQSGNLGNVLMVTAAGLPVNGSTVYVTLWSLVNGAWVNNQYTYIAFSKFTLAVMTSPPPGSSFSDTTVTFVWTPGSYVTGYKLFVGKTPGGKQYYSSGNLGKVLTLTVPFLPADASTVYVTLFSLVQGQWLSNSYTYTAWNAATGQAALVTPPPGSQFTDATETFTWTAGTHATGYRLFVGKTPGGKQYHSSGNLNVLTVTVNNLPSDASTIYVTLLTQLGGRWYSTPYTYTAWNGVTAPAQMVTPPPGSQFSDITVSFLWTSGSGATDYRLDVGKAPGGKQYYNSRNLGKVLTFTVPFLPGDASTVYVTLYSLVQGQWLSNSYTYTAWNASTGQAAMGTPPPGSQFIDATETFTWTAGTHATGYRMDIGSKPGGRGYYTSRNSSNQNATVSNLPSDGSTVYVTLWTQIAGRWYSTPYTYTAWNGALTQAQMVTPPPGSQFSNTTVTFVWLPGGGATGYKLSVGKTPGGKQYYGPINLDKGVLTLTLKNLPSDGSAVYVTLYTQLNGVWLSNSYTYTAWNAATGQAALLTPLPGSQFSDPTVTFVWTAGTGATAYRLDVGKRRGTHEYYQSANLNVLTTTVGFLPTDGSTVYVTLYTQLKGKWYSTTYTYKAVPQ